MTLLQVHDLGVSYSAHGHEVCAVDRVSFELAAGEALGIVGESGSGKSQTALAVIGLLGTGARCTGRIEFDGQSLLNARPRQLARIRGAEIGMVFQDPMTSLNPYLRIGAQIQEVLGLHRGLRGRAARAEAERWLSTVQITDARRRLTQYPHELSGGMRQRVMIAMALCCGPRLLIADEPTTALDVTVQAQVLRLLAELQRDLGLATLLITHNFGVVSELCQHVLVMHHGMGVESGTTERVLHAPQAEYTQRLIAAVPRLSGPVVVG